MNYGKAVFHYLKNDDDVVYYRVQSSGKIKTVDVFSQNRYSGDLEFQFGFEFENHEQTIDIILANWDDFDFAHDNYFTGE